jgi:hypothetical protein
LELHDEGGSLSDAAHAPEPHRPPVQQQPLERGHAPPSRSAQLASVLACLALAACAGLYRIRTFDTLFHLASGRFIVRNGRVPTTDPFSFSFRGAPWINHS